MTQNERLAQLRSMSDAELLQEYQFYYDQSRQTTLEWECQEINYQIDLILKVTNEKGHTGA